MAEFIPNSYQTPNDYADRFMHLLTGEEWKALSYTMRRIFGFNKRQDNISLSQYQHGLKDSGGAFLDHGTGLSRSTLVRVLSELVRFGLLIRIAANDKHSNEGDCYALQLNASKVDVAALEERAARARETNVARSHKARLEKARRASLTRSVGQTTLEDEPGLSDRPPTQSVSQTEPSLSDRPPPVCETDRARSVGQTDNNQGEIQVENQREIQTHTHDTQNSATRESVCVEDDLTEDDYLAYARAQKSIHTPAAWAMTHWDRRDRDTIVREWKRAQSPEAIEAARAAPTSKNLTFGEASQILQSMRVYDRRPPAEIISEMPLDPDVRRRMIERFATPEGAAVAAD